MKKLFRVMSLLLAFTFTLSVATIKASAVPVTPRSSQVYVVDHTETLQRRLSTSVDIYGYEFDLTPYISWNDISGTTTTYYKTLSIPTGYTYTVTNKVSYVDKDADNIVEWLICNYVFPSEERYKIETYNYKLVRL